MNTAAQSRFGNLLIYLLPTSVIAILLLKSIFSCSTVVHVMVPHCGILMILKQNKSWKSIKFYYGMFQGRDSP